MKTRDDRKKEKHIVHKTSNLINNSAEDERYSTQKFRTRTVLWFHYFCTICYFTVEWFCQITIIFVACPASK